MSINLTVLHIFDNFVTYVLIVCTEYIMFKRAVFFCKSQWSVTLYFSPDKRQKKAYPMELTSISCNYKSYEKTAKRCNFFCIFN